MKDLTKGQLFQITKMIMLCSIPCGSYVKSSKPSVDSNCKKNFQNDNVFQIKTYSKMIMLCSIKSGYYVKSSQQI